MRIGVIVEGKTDWIVFERLVPALCPGSVPTLIHPKQDELEAGKSTGWTEVRKWFQEKRQHLLLLIQLGGDDLLIVHMDGDVAPDDCKPCRPDAEAQWQAVSTRALSWTGLVRWPERVVLAICLQQLEAWICAALDDGQAQDARLECCAAPERQIAEEHWWAVEQRDVATYRETFAPAVLREWKRVLDCCPVGAGRLDAALKEFLER